MKVEFEYDDFLILDSLKLTTKVSFPNGVVLEEIYDLKKGEWELYCYKHGILEMVIKDFLKIYDFSEREVAISRFKDLIRDVKNQFEINGEKYPIIEINGKRYVVIKPYGFASEFYYSKGFLEIP